MIKGKALRESYSTSSDYETSFARYIGHYGDEIDEIRILILSDEVKRFEENEYLTLKWD